MPSDTISVVRSGSLMERSDLKEERRQEKSMQGGCEKNGEDGEKSENEREKLNGVE